MAKKQLKGKGKAGKVTLMNLDLEDPDDSDSGSLDGVADADVVEKETQMTKALMKVLCQCNLCGKGIPCKVGKNGDHIRPTFTQIGAWVKCLVRLSCSQISLVDARTLFLSHAANQTILYR